MEKEVVLAAGGKKALASSSAMETSSGEDRVSGSTANRGSSTSGYTCMSTLHI